MLDFSIAQPEDSPIIKLNPSQLPLIPADLLESEDPSYLKAVIGPFILQSQTPESPNQVTLSEYMDTLKPEQNDYHHGVNRNTRLISNQHAIFLSMEYIRITFLERTRRWLNVRRGTFGVVLAVREDVIWECAGLPTATLLQPTQKVRGRWFCFKRGINTVATSHSYLWPFKSRMTVHTWIDNDRAVQHLNRLLQSNRSPRRYPNDHDLLSHIKWLWTQITRADWKIEWVEGHQDAFRPLDNLPCNACKAEYNCGQTCHELLSRGHIHPSKTTIKQPVLS